MCVFEARVRQNCLRCHHSQQSHTMHTQTPTQPRPSRLLHVRKPTTDVSLCSLLAINASHNILFGGYFWNNSVHVGAMFWRNVMHGELRACPWVQAAPVTLSTAKMSPAVAHFKE